jgi:hypothetical protein
MTNEQRQPVSSSRPKRERRVHLAPNKTEHVGPYRHWFSVEVESGVIGLQATPETGIGGDGPIYEACGGRCSMQGMMASARTTRHILIEDEPKAGETLVHLEAGDSVIFDNDAPDIPPISLSLTNEGRDPATALVKWQQNGPDDTPAGPRKPQS